MIIVPEDLLEEKDMASLMDEEVKVETNKAYNEAEKFISSVEKENQELTETTEGKLQEMDQAIEDSQQNNGDDGMADYAPFEKKKNTKLSNSNTNKEQPAVVEGGNRNTTISYRLLNRRDIYLPNPVYTCYGSGKIVINIEVDNLGKVKKATYNQNASSSSNQCLIDAATEYALQAEFTSDASRAKQLGTITFNFPGQG
ncbi:hypothetical protein EI546_09055 [Aequorivita sp. H23M31]|uniref:Energy transducer TonB n=1 Tax=Aequorivita ciconiae TaxID=2494375 RepID=A0A410G3I7_9FLAO|nr:hypothetical protein [Aequorivita sp. H23M31]QAA81858.1 hypothetical protein EI546_09055 [Aequorivita sp. H23M31]